MLLTIHLRIEDKYDREVVLESAFEQVYRVFDDWDNTSKKVHLFYPSPAAGSSPEGPTISNPIVPSGYTGQAILTADRRQE